jgi:hypothetical protein
MEDPIQHKGQRVGRQVGHHGHQPQHQERCQDPRLRRTVTTIILIDRASEHTHCFTGTTMHELALSGVTILRNLGRVLYFPWGPDYIESSFDTFVQRTHVHGAWGAWGLAGATANLSCILFRTGYAGLCI